MQMNQSGYSVIVMESTTDPSRVAVMYPTGDLPIDELICRHVDTSRPYKVMRVEELPTIDFDFYDAWMLIPQEGGGYSLMVDMERAREVQRDRLRMERKPLLKALDIQFMRAVECANITVQQEIAMKKQVLRDIPNHPAIATATNTTILRALTLDVLTCSDPIPMETPTQE